MKKYNQTHIIRLGDKEKRIKDLTLQDLYELYDKQRLMSLIKILNNKPSLILKKEE